jgi:hypothetical protein
MPILIGHLLKIITQAVLLPIAEKAFDYFTNKIEQHEKKVKAKTEKALKESEQLIEDVKSVIDKSEI